MKKPQKEKTAKGDKTRLKILETTVKMMSEKGPDAVSMREIASHLEITKPVLYYYFKNKETLIRAAFHEGTRHFREVDTLVLDDSIPLEKKIALILANHLNFIKKHPDMPKCALKVIASPSEGVLSGMAMEMKKEHRAMLRQVIHNAARKGEVAKEAANDISHLLSAAITHFIIEAKENGPASLDAGLPARLARIICAGARNIKASAAVLFLSAILGFAALAAALEPPTDSREPKGLSLNDAVETALRNNTAVITAEETRHIYKEKVREYWGSVFPQINATMQYSRYLDKPNADILGAKDANIYTGSLDVDQVLWAGGKIYTGIKIAVIYSSASDEQLKIAQKGVAKTVKQVYYSVLLAKALADIQKESLELARQHLATINEQYKQGIASDLAVLRQKVEVSNTEPALTQARNLYEEGLLELKNLLGLDPEADIAPSDGFNCGARNPGEPAALYNAALQARPEYRNMKYQRDLYREMVAIERAGHFPYLSAYASRQYYGSNGSGFPGVSDRTWSTIAGLRLSLPLFAGGTVGSRTRQAHLQALIADTNLRELGRKIKIEVKKAWLKMAEASERLASQTTAVEIARKALAATEIRFRNGLSSQLELNDTSLALNRSQTLYIQAQHDTCSAATELKWTLGE
jgi:outer membrane protein TolC/DNA-binding transcriptional regulator YbjK